MDVPNPLIAPTPAPTPAPQETPAPAVTAAPDFLQSVPESYRDKPYLKTIKSTEDLFKQFDGLQSLAGKKSGIPASDAPPEEWNKFYKTLGRPDDPTAYEFDKAEYPEGFEPPDELINEFKKSFHEAGLTPAQAKKAMSIFNAKQVEGLKNLQELERTQKEKMDQEFEELTKKTFGVKKDAAIAKANQLMNMFAPDEFKAHIANLDNQSLVLLTSVLNGVAEKYINEDTFQKDPANSTTSLDKRAEAQKLMQSEAYKDFFHVDHVKTVTRVNELYGNNPKG